MLLLPAASVNVPAATSMVAAPLAVGVNVAVYTIVDEAEKLLKAPLDTVISPTAKSAVASLEVNVSASVASLEVKLSAPSAAVIVMVGAAASAPCELYVAPLLVPWLPLPLKSYAVVPLFSAKRQ